jgi:hypothetical protein
MLRTRPSICRPTSGRARRGSLDKIWAIAPRRRPRQMFVVALNAQQNSNVHQVLGCGRVYVFGRGRKATVGRVTALSVHTASEPPKVGGQGTRGRRQSQNTLPCRRIGRLGEAANVDTGRRGDGTSGWRAEWEQPASSTPCYRPRFAGSLPTIRFHPQAAPPVARWRQARSRFAPLVCAPAAIAFKQPDRHLLSLPFILSHSLPPECPSPLTLTHIMASRAIPSHLKPSAAEEGGFAPRHHGKSQSHVVSWPLILSLRPNIARVCSRVHVRARGLTAIAI